MLLEVVGSLLPAAAGIAASPFPIVAAILVVGGPRGRVAGAAFVVGWLLGLSALTAAAVGLGGLLGDAGSGPWAAWGRVLLGLVLLGLGVRKAVGRPSGPVEPVEPAWMGGLAAATPARALAVGAALAALNPKNIAFAAASASVIGEAEQGATSVLAQAAVFVLLASTTVVGVVVVGRFGGARGRRALARARRGLVRHNDVIVAVVLVLIGAAVVGEGLRGIA